jgi:hypothetical protein
MGLADEIFPTERRERFVQTEWADGWVLTAVGFQEAARLLTEASRKIGASIDQVGLVVFFLQRHRMELAMKELLVGAGMETKDITTHSLTKLWDLCVMPWARLRARRPTPGPKSMLSVVSS